MYPTYVLRRVIRLIAILRTRSRSRRAKILVAILIEDFLDYSVDLLLRSPIVGHLVDLIIRTKG